MNNPPIICSEIIKTCPELAWYASQLGRFDFVTIILGCVSIILAVGGIISYIQFNRTVSEKAQEVAKETAESLTEKIVNEYIQKHLSDILRLYSEFAQEQISAKKANEIAMAQDNDSENENN